MQGAELDNLLGSIAEIQSCLLTAGTGAVIDCRRGRCPVGVLVTTALSDGDMTFNGSPDQSDTQPTLYSVKKEGQDPVAAYTFDHSTVTGFFPLDPVVFHSVRWIQPVSSGGDTETIYIVTDVV